MFYFKMARLAKLNFKQDLHTKSVLHLMKWLWLFSVFCSVVDLAWMSSSPNITTTAPVVNLTVSAEESDKQNEICLKLSKDHDDAIVLRATLLFSNKLILITDNWMVLEVPTTNLVQSFGVLPIANVPSNNIEEKWPAFQTNAKFSSYKKDIFNIFSIELVEQIVVFQVKNQVILEYNIQSGVLTESLGGFAYSKPVSSITSPSDLYTVSMEFNQVLSLQMWRMIKDKHKVKLIASSLDKMYLYFLRSETQDSSHRVVFVSKNTPNFYNQNHNIMKNKLRPINIWGVPAGFIFNDYFHFFLDHKVNVFSARISQQGNLWYIESKLYSFSYKNYFLCGNSHTSQKPYPNVIPQPVTNIMEHTVTENIVAKTESMIINNFQNAKNKASKFILYLFILIAILALLSILASVYVNKHFLSRRRVSSKNVSSRTGSGSSRHRKSSEHFKSSRGCMSGKLSVDSSKSRMSLRSGKHGSHSKTHLNNPHQKSIHSRQSAKLKNASGGSGIGGKILPVVNQYIESLKMSNGARSKSLHKNSSRHSKTNLATTTSSKTNNNSQSVSK